MSCYKPNYIVKQQVDSLSYLEFKMNKKYAEQRGWKANSKVPNEIFQFVCHDSLKYKDYFKEFEQVKPNSTYKLETVPCGCCIGCRLDYSKDWATRCMLEAQDWKDNYFITLTYDDEHLPIGKYCNNTLVNEDLKKFIKDLRRYYSYHYKHNDIRFFACGEYG